MNSVKFLDLKSEVDEIKERVQECVEKILYTNTNFILGKELQDFEKHFSKYINTKYWIGVGNGTDALEIAIQSLDLEEGSEIITQSNTFISTCLGITYNNHKIKLVDIDVNTYQMDLDLLEKSITNKTKVILIVHLTGSCCNMERLCMIVKKHNLILIEDCAQCVGAVFNGKKLGSFGVLSTYSFYPCKNLGAFGDGGAICTDNDDLNNKIMKIRNTGCIEKYNHELIGRNSRLDTFQASILDIKLERLDINNLKRRKNAILYHELLKDVYEIELPYIEDGCIPAYHLFIIRCSKRDELKAHLKNNNIQTGIHYLNSIPELSCYEDLFDKSKFEKAIDNSNKILSLPMYPNLSEKDIRFVCEKIINYYNM